MANILREPSSARTDRTLGVHHVYFAYSSSYSPYQLCTNTCQRRPPSGRKWRWRRPCSKAVVLLASYPPLESQVMPTYGNCLDRTSFGEDGPYFGSPSCILHIQFSLFSLPALYQYRSEKTAERKEVEMEMTPFEGSSSTGVVYYGSQQED